MDNIIICSNCYSHCILCSDLDEIKLTKSVTFAGVGSRREDQGSTLRLAPHRQSNKEPDKRSPNHVLLGLKAAIGLVFFAIVLISSVFSKLTLVSLTERLRIVTMPFQNESKTEQQTHQTAISYSNVESATPEEAVSIYWQLLVILIVPNLLTFLRCFFFGFLGKTRKNFPWPKRKAVIMVSKFNSNRNNNNQQQ